MLGWHPRSMRPGAVERQMKSFGAAELDLHTLVWTGVVSGLAAFHRRA
jgi:hypothetical protein